MDRNELVEKAARAMYEAGPYMPAAYEDWEVLPDSWKEEWRDGARAALDAILPDVIEAIQDEAAQIADREAKQTPSIDARFSFEHAARRIRAAVLGDALTTKEN